MTEFGPNRIFTQQISFLVQKMCVHYQSADLDIKFSQHPCTLAHFGGKISGKILLFKNLQKPLILKVQ